MTLCTGLPEGRIQSWPTTPSLRESKEGLGNPNGTAIGDTTTFQNAARVDANQASGSRV
ncbi:MAG: hypothetical protein AAGF95_23530 [Chloroflexota bacterium]